MSQDVPENLLYSKEHEWVDPDTGWMGITDYAQSQLGDVVFVELPENGRSVSYMDPFMVVESVQAVSDVYAPLDGTVEEVNEELETHPEQVNDDPYSSGKMARIEGEVDPDQLMEAAEYEQFLG